MPPRKKSGRITLRMDPDIHRRVEVAAKTLGIDINGILNLIIRQGLPFYEHLADLTTNPHMSRLLSRWLKLNPGGDIQEFIIEVHLMAPVTPDDGTRQTIRFLDGKWYTLNAAGDDFVEVPPPEQQRSNEDAQK